MGILVAHPQSGYSFTASRLNWNLEMLVFVKGGKPDNPEKNPRSRDENQQQTQPTYGVNSGNRTTTAPSSLAGYFIHYNLIPPPPPPRLSYERGGDARHFA